MRLNVCWLIFALIACPVSLAAQEMPILRGTVEPHPSEKPRPKLWGDIRIRVINTKTNKEVPGPQDKTDDHEWHHVAPLAATVDVWFDKACYEPGIAPRVYVREKDQRLEKPVYLNKSLACSDAEQNRRRSRSGGSTPRSAEMVRGSSQRGATETTSAGAQTASARRSSSIAEKQLPAAPSYWANESRKHEAWSADSLPSSKKLKEDLHHEAKLARAGQFFDTFQYNFRVKWVVYGNVAALAKTLWQFRTDEQNHDLFKQLGSVPPDSFDDAVRAQFDIPGPVNFENIKRVVTDTAMSPSVRGSATVAFLSIKPALPEATVGEMIEYYRRQAQDPSSEIFVSSVIALARHGDSSDRAKLLEDTRSKTDPRRAIASIKAVAVAQIFLGPEPLPAGAETLAEVAKEAEDPSVRAAAVSALRPFAFRGDETAINALVTGARKDSEEEVRLRATLSLGTGNLEDVPWVRRVLRSVSKTDPSRVVRRAASVTLSGARWLPGLVMGRL